MPGQGELKNRLKRKRALDSGAEEVIAGRKGARQGVHTCKYCAKDISQAVRIKCIVCPSFSLCLDCFRVGAEVSPHKHDHPYQVHADLSFPLYDLAWGADEEMLLLEGIDACGLGNWAAVGSLVSTKSAAECKQHYLEVYIRSPVTPLPHPKPEMQNVDPLQIAQERKIGGQAEDAQQQLPVQEPAGLIDSSADPEPAAGALVGALRPSGASDVALVDPANDAVLAAAQTTGELEVQREDLASASTEAAALPAKKLRCGKADVAGNGLTAESSGVGEPQQQLSTRGLPASRPPAKQEIPAGAASGPGSSKADLKKVGGASPELTGFHTKRSEFEHEYDNDAELLISELELRPTDTPVEQAEKLKLIEVYNQRLTERERRREAVIAQGLLDVRRRQAAERRQSPAEKEVQAQMRVFARFHSPSEHDGFLDGLLLEQRIRTRIQELKDLRAAGVRTMAEAELYETDMRRRGGEAGRNLGRSQRYVARTGTSDMLVMSQAAVASLALSESGSRVRELSRLRSSAPGLQSASYMIGNAAAHLTAWRSRSGVPLDVTATPGSDLLSQKERSLCATQRLLPSQYLAYKASFLREAERRGGKFRRSDAGTMFRTEPGIPLRVYDLLVSLGWLQPDDHLQQGDASLLEGELPPASLGNTASPANSGM